jgi:LDH2 family malate/lactate/ureidoglycolate dehydrogenase
MKNTITYDKLLSFCKNVMEKNNCSGNKAEVVADVLVEADARGIFSHGTARLKRYINHIKDKVIIPEAEPEVIFETPVSAVIDGNAGIGQYISKEAMKIAIEKAKKSGISIVVVKNSNHFGIAGYYAEMAVKDDLIGISLTNTAPLVIPTFGVERVLGTNPISVGIPCSNGNFLLDMATSVASRGKVEQYNRLNRDLNDNWAAGGNGEIMTNPAEVLDLFLNGPYGGMLPLGGNAEKSGGHKGYGLSLLVDILTGGLSSSTGSSKTYGEKTLISHFFAAINPKIFGDEDSVKKSIDGILNTVKNSKKEPGKKRIYIHGEKEKERREKSMKDGIELDDNTVLLLTKIAGEFGEKITFE